MPPQVDPYAPCRARCHQGKRSLRYGKGKRVLGVLERAHTRDLGDCACGAGRLVIGRSAERSLHKLGLRDHVKRPSVREQHIDSAEQLAARSQAPTGFAGALCHSTNLPTPLVKHRQDQVRLFELGLIEDEYLRAICPGASHARRAPLVLGIVAKAANLGLIVTPAGLDLHVQLQKDLRAKDALKIATASIPIRLIISPPLPMMMPFGPRARRKWWRARAAPSWSARAHRRSRQRSAGSHHGCGARPSRAQTRPRGSRRTRRCPCPRGTSAGLGQEVSDGLDKRIDVEVLDRRRHDLIVVFHKLVGGLKLLHDLCGVGLIGLGEHQDLLGTGILDALGNPASPLPIGLVASIKTRRRRHRSVRTTRSC